MENIAKSTFTALAFLLFIALSSVILANEPGTASAISDVEKEMGTSKTYTSIFMIAGVVAIVGLAIYLSFSNEQEKQTVKK
jgi:hypothetical protein